MYRKGEKLQQTQDIRNSGVLRSWINRWVWASYANYGKIEKEMVGNRISRKNNKLADEKLKAANDAGLKGPELKKVCDELNKMKISKYSLLAHQNKHRGEPAIIVGGGISLEKLIPLLKDWKGVIFAPESLISTLQYYGHKPEYICLFDGALTAWDAWFKDHNFKGSTLVTHPSVDPKVIEKWKGDKIYYLMMHFSKLQGKLKQDGKSIREIEIEIKNQLLGFDFFENILPSVYGFIGASILNAGCVVNNAIEVANFMGYGPLFLCGVDYGFKNWILRYPGVFKKEGRWTKDKVVHIQHEEDGKIVDGTPLGREIIISNNGIPTTEEQSEYKVALMSVYKLDRPQLFDCSDGIITELPKLDITEVVEKNGKGFEDRYRTDQGIIQVADAYFNLR